MKQLHRFRNGLTNKYGNGFSRNNLYRFISFYKSFPNIFQVLNGKTEIVPSVMGQSKIIPSVLGFFAGPDFYDLLKPIKPLRLSWTHYSIILQESTAEAVPGTRKKQQERCGALVPYSAMFHHSTTIDFYSHRTKPLSTMKCISSLLLYKTN